VTASAQTARPPADLELEDLMKIDVQSTWRMVK
jgi:hypothetical protein